MLPRDIVAVSVAGNTVMTHFFAGLPTKHMRLEPYVPVAHRPGFFKASEFDLRTNSSARVLLFPSRAGYVGGDVVADVLASGMFRSNKLSMLIDVGTNGEIVLGKKDWLVSCACSAGPAFEGGEVSSGMRAMDGAIDRIRVNDDLSTTYHVIGDPRASGICGSGLIDLMAEMYCRGVIDRKARIQNIRSDRVRSSDAGFEYVVVKREDLGERTSGDLVITDAELQNLLRTKAAIYGACSTLLKKMGEDLQNISSIVIAGGFVYHLDVGRAIWIGMFPDVHSWHESLISMESMSGSLFAANTSSAASSAWALVSKMNGSVASRELPGCTYAPVLLSRAVNIEPPMFLAGETPNVVRSVLPKLSPLGRESRLLGAWGNEYLHGAILRAMIEAKKIAVAVFHLSRHATAKAFVNLESASAVNAIVAIGKFQIDVARDYPTMAASANEVNVGNNELSPWREILNGKLEFVASNASHKYWSFRSHGILLVVSPVQAARQRQFTVPRVFGVVPVIMPSFTNRAPFIPGEFLGAESLSTIVTVVHDIHAKGLAIAMVEGLARLRIGLIFGAVLPVDHFANVAAHQATIGFPIFIGLAVLTAFGTPRMESSVVYGVAARTLPRVALLKSLPWATWVNLTSSKREPSGSFIQLKKTFGTFMVSSR